MEINDTNGPKSQHPCYSVRECNTSSSEKTLQAVKVFVWTGTMLKLNMRLVLGSIWFGLHSHSL